MILTYAIWTLKFESKLSRFWIKIILFYSIRIRVDTLPVEHANVNDFAAQNLFRETWHVMNYYTIHSRVFHSWLCILSRIASPRFFPRDLTRSGETLERYSYRNDASRISQNWSEASYYGSSREEILGSKKLVHGWCPFLPT